MSLFLALSSMLNTLIPKFLSVIEEERDREVVMATVDVIHDLLEKVGQPVLQVENATDQILTKMKLIFTHQVFSSFLVALFMYLVDSGKCSYLSTKDNF